MTMRPWALFAALGCASAGSGIPVSPGTPPAAAKPDLKAYFIRLEADYQRKPRAEAAQILVDEREVQAVPPFKVVGLLSVEGKQTEKLAAFVDFASDAGAEAGCSVLIQRDAFELGARLQRMIIPRGGPNAPMPRGSLGRDWHPSDRLLWQFLCGVPGATAEEQQATLKRGVALAVAERRKELGGYEPCEPYVPTGSHILKRDVCADDPAHHSQADSRSPVPFGF